MRDEPRIEEDLWGRICLDFHRGDGDGSCILRRDDDFEDEFSCEPYFWRGLEEVEQQVMPLVEGRVLDVGCGPGRHSLWLQDQGHQVTGIDLSRGVAQVARERGLDAHALSLWDVDSLQRTYDTVIMMGNNAGLAGTVESTGRFLEHLGLITSSGALLVVNSIDPTATENPRHFAYHRRNEEAGRYKGEVKIRVEYETAVSPWFELALFEQQVYEALAADRGWEPDTAFTTDNSFFLFARRR